MDKRVEKNLRRLLTKGKGIFLAYDQGLEHGPRDFNEKNINPLYIIDIAKSGGYNAVIFHKGIAEKYSYEIKKSKVPLIIKLNGKTCLFKGEPVSKKVCSVQNAIRLGAVAVGYTIYIGSGFEPEMFEEFREIQEVAHHFGIPVIAWIYPRGYSVEGKNPQEMMAYACRVGLELGADIIKIRYEGDKEAFKWAVKNAGRAKVVVAGGSKKNQEELLNEVKDIIDAGGIGLAIGRNIWQSDNPLELTEKIKKVIW